jgi:hypothetical protein
MLIPNFRRTKLKAIANHLHNASKFRISDKLYKEHYDECIKLYDLTDIEIEFVNLELIELNFLDPLTDKNDWMRN